MKADKVLATDATPTTQEEPAQSETHQMQPEEYQELRDQAHDIELHDVHLGRFLHSLVYHLGHLHGFDPSQFDAPATPAEEAAVPPVDENAQLNSLPPEGVQHAN